VLVALHELYIITIYLELNIRLVCILLQSAVTNSFWIDNYAFRFHSIETNVIIQCKSVSQIQHHMHSRWRGATKHRRRKPARRHNGCLYSNRRQLVPIALTDRLYKYKTKRGLKRHPVSLH
jgi:hypothetical protein